MLDHLYWVRILLRNKQLNELRSIRKKLRKLQKASKRDRDMKLFDNYYSNYEEYENLYSEANRLIKEELKKFELKIVKLSEKEIDELAKKGKHNAILGAYLTRISDFSGNLASYIENLITTYENALKAKAYLDDAFNEKRRAFKLIDAKDWNGSVEASQHSIEHSMKSLFRLVGVKHPFKHDPTEKFGEVVEKLKILPNWELTNLARIRWIARVWVTIHKESMYAFHNIPAKDFFKEKDAKVLKKYADEVYAICNRLVTNVRSGQLRIYSS